MKKIRALVTTLAVAALLVLLPKSSAITADAAAPKNYVVRYISSENEWRYQEGSTFNEENSHREIYYLRQSLKDGDLVAVESKVSGADALDLGTAKLSNLTVLGSEFAVIYSGEISECYILAESACSINANVITAHVYDVATANFNGNVTELIATAEGLDFNSNIGCSGTVTHFHAYSINQPKSFYNLYNFDKNTLNVQDGNLKTLYYNYDETAPANYTAPQSASNTAANTASNKSTTPASGSADEYDDVPKTGETNLVFWFLAISAVCGIGSLILKKRAN